MQYNTTRSHLFMKEYGRHIQNMVDFLIRIQDPKFRQQNANSVIELMGYLNPHLKNIEDYRHKLWDHLFLISDFRLDVESPYPKPTRESIKARPEPMRYPKRYPKFNHLGKNIELVIDKALREENPEKRQGFANNIAYYMKLTYSSWHKELVHDDTIQSELSGMTQGQLEFNNKPFVKHRTDNRPDRDDYGHMMQGRGGYRQPYNRGGRGPGRDNRGGNRGNRNFKKRY